jgi:hypothetical protein
LRHFNPCNLAEDKSQQWQSLSHQCDVVERTLAQPEAVEPVAWECAGCGRICDDPKADFDDLKSRGFLSCCPERQMKPLYTTPPIAPDERMRRALAIAAGRFNLMCGVGLVNGVDPKVGYREIMEALSRANEGNKSEGGETPSVFDECSTAPSDSTPQDATTQREAIAPVWPIDCIDPDSCSRHRACKYFQCKHQGCDIAEEVDRATIALQTRAGG